MDPRGGGARCARPGPWLPSAAPAGLVRFFNGSQGRRCSLRSLVPLATFLPPLRGYESRLRGYESRLRGYESPLRGYESRVRGWTQLDAGEVTRVVEC
jgi:hypothetical protein